MRMDDECRGVRQRRKQTDPTCCPVCGITLRPNEIEQHYSLEVDRLHKLSVQKPKKSNTSPTLAKDLPTLGMSSGSGGSSDACSSSTLNETTKVVNAKECWETYQRIRNNRNSRLKLRNRKRKADDPPCPICNERIPDDLNLHVELCLRRNEKHGTNADVDDDDDDDSIDVEGESFEEYEWAGQTRVRASSLLEGGYSAAGMQTTVVSASNTAEDDCDEDLNVDGDDTQIYGASQYTERDIILPSAEDNKKENLYLRNLVIGQPATPKSPATSGRERKHDTSNESADDADTVAAATAPNENGNTITAASTSHDGIARTQIECESTASCSTITINLKDGTVKETTSISSQSQAPYRSTDAASAQIIDALKEKIREYETIIRNKSKCLICMDEFQIPVVSICCWHVHCEECWLRTLGARKLCPQCNMITSPTDLRRIYM